MQAHGLNNAGAASPPSTDRTKQTPVPQRHADRTNHDASSVDILLPTRRRHNGEVQLQRGLLGWLQAPQKGAHGHGGAFFLDLDEFAATVASLGSKAGALLLNVIAVGVAFYGAVGSALEGREAWHDLQELPIQKAALRDAAASQESGRLNRRAALSRLANAGRSLLTKTLLSIPACIGALTMGLSVLFGPALLGAVIPALGTFTSVLLMQIAVPCIALFGSGVAVMALIEVGLAQGRRTALRQLRDDKHQAPEVSLAAKMALTKEHRIAAWRIGAAISGLALAVGVVATFFTGPIGLALLLPGALALPVCNGAVAMLTRRDEHAHDAEEAQDLAVDQIHAGSLSALATAALTARSEMNACKDVPVGLLSDWRIVRAWSRRQSRDWRLNHPFIQLDPPERMLGEVMRPVLEARQKLAVHGCTEADKMAIREAVQDEIDNMDSFVLRSDPVEKTRTLLGILIAEDAFGDFVAACYRDSTHIAGGKTLWQRLAPTAGADNSVEVSSGDIRRLVEAAPEEERADMVQRLCVHGLRVVTRTIQRDAAARERTKLSQFATAARALGVRDSTNSSVANAK